MMCTNAQHFYIRKNSLAKLSTSAVYLINSYVFVNQPPSKSSNSAGANYIYLHLVDSTLVRLKSEQTKNFVWSLLFCLKSFKRTWVSWLSLVIIDRRGGGTTAIRVWSVINNWYTDYVNHLVDNSSKKFGITYYHTSQNLGSDQLNTSQN